MKQTVIQLELNEVNFEAIGKYIEMGQLPHFRSLIETYGVAETTSETDYDHLEPWIQWVTAHTGKTLAQHGIFRLGDIVKSDILQIWEELEAAGASVGAISPMNASNRTRQAAFFVPDPWTKTPVTGPFLMRKLSGAISQVVNDNAQGRISIRSAFWLAVGLLRYARPKNYGRYVDLIKSRKSKTWVKPLLLDLLLSDIFIGQLKHHQPNYASLFLNAAAHIQHHYLFSSRAYEGSFKNPSWYIDDQSEPVLEVYQLYDYIVGEIVTAAQHQRLIVATGLHQDPHDKVTFYWRLRNHQEFLEKHNISFESVEPRMSRDFLISCGSEKQALDAERSLLALNSSDGEPLFSVDNRETDLFVMLTYPQDVGRDFTYSNGAEVFQNFREDIAFVAIKNGQHNGRGYLIDTASPEFKSVKHVLPLSALYDRAKDAVLSRRSSTAV